MWRTRLHALGLGTVAGAPSAPLVAIVYVMFLLVVLRAGDDGRGTVFCCANAVLLAALLLRRPRRWWPPVIACAVAIVFANLATGRSPTAALAFGVVDLITPIAAAAALHRLAGDEVASLGTPLSVGRFAIVAGVLAPVLGGVAGAAVIHATFEISYIDALVNWVASDGTGILLVTPFLLMLWRGEMRLWVGELSVRERVLGIGMLAATIGGSVLAFDSEKAPLTFVPVLLVVLCACSFGRAGTAAAVLIVAAVGTFFVGGAEGQFALVAGSSQWEWLYLQAYLATTLLVALPVAASLEERDRLTRALAGSEQRFRALAENSTDLIVWCDADQNCRYASPAAAELLGREADALIGRSIMGLVHEDDRPRVEMRLAPLLTRSGPATTVDFRARHADGRWLWMEARARSMMAADGRVDGVHLTVRDVSAHKSIQAVLAEAANTDMLTGVANRRAFSTLLSMAVTRARKDHEPLSLAILDLDYFKHVNDRWGHAAGDETLRRFALICQQAVRGGDVLARIGGEEFSLLMPGTDLTQGQLVCERLRAAIAELRIPVAGGDPIAITASVGLALLEAGDDMQSLMRHADRALYAAKAAGRNQVMTAVDDPVE